MTISNSRFAYPDCFAVMDSALEDSIGARTLVKDLDAANFLRMRMNQARKLDREYNKKIYAEGEPMHGHSIYDPLVFRIKQIGEQIWLYAELAKINNGAIELLSGLPSQEQVETSPYLTLSITNKNPEPKLIEPPKEEMKRRM